MAKKQQEVIPAADNVEQIREILFGGHIKDYEQRFQLLERNLEQAQNKINAAFNKRLDSLNEHLDGVRKQLKDEQVQRLDGYESLDGLIQNQASELTRQLDSLEATSQQQSTELAGALDALKTTLTQQIDANRNAIGQAMDDLDGRLSQTSVSRQELAKLLTGLAGKLEAQPARRKNR